MDVEVESETLLTEQQRFILDGTEGPNGRDFAKAMLVMCVMFCLSLLIVTADGGARAADKEPELHPFTVVSAAPTVMTPAKSKMVQPLDVKRRKVFIVGLPDSGAARIASYFACGGEIRTSLTQPLHVSEPQASKCHSETAVRRLAPNVS